MPSHISMLKMNNVAIALETARKSRDILGANGIVDDYCIMRHMNNLESVYTYEGTNDIHKLIIGEKITGIAAFDVRNMNNRIRPATHCLRSWFSSSAFGFCAACANQSTGSGNAQNRKSVPSPPSCMLDRARYQIRFRKPCNFLQNRADHLRIARLHRADSCASPRNPFREYTEGLSHDEALQLLQESRWPRADAKRHHFHWPRVSFRERWRRASRSACGYPARTPNRSMARWRSQTMPG